MPSPIAHTVTGAALAYVHPSTPRNPMARRYALRLLGVLALANLADLDFIPHYLTSVRVHHTFTHSLLFVLVLCAAITLLAYWRGVGSLLASFTLIFMVYGSHVILDMLGGGSGVSLWWPISTESIRAPFQLFPNVNYGSGLIDGTHVQFLVFESVYSVAVIGLSLVAKGQSARVVGSLRAGIRRP